MSDNKKRLTTVRLQEMVQGYWKAAALMSAVELGLFTAISKGAGTVAEIAGAIDITEPNAERIVTAAVAMELIEVADGRYRNAPDVERFLVEGGPRYAGPWILFTKPRWDKWGDLTEHLRAKDVDVLGQYMELSVEDYRKYHAATYSVGRGAARLFVRQVDLSGRSRMMDLGGGSGAYCIAAVKDNPGLRAVVLDLPPVVTIAGEFIEENGVSDRVEAAACDFTHDPFPVDCDVAVMASNLPAYSREIIAEVIQKAFDALLPGGEMHLVGEMLDDDRTGPLGPALWGLSEAVCHSTGIAHTEAECIGYLEAAGFEGVAVHEFVKGTLSRVAGVKPV